MEGVSGAATVAQCVLEGWSTWVRVSAWVFVVVVWISASDVHLVRQWLWARNTDGGTGSSCRSCNMIEGKAEQNSKTAKEQKSKRMKCLFSGYFFVTWSGKSRELLEGLWVGLDVLAAIFGAFGALREWGGD